MEWIYLAVAGVLEVAWAVALKYSDGLTRWWPSAITGVCMLASTFFLGLAIQKIPLGTGYAIWTGIGAVGTSTLGILLFAEPASMLRLMFIGMIVIGILGLKMTSSA